MDGGITAIVYFSSSWNVLLFYFKNDIAIFISKMDIAISVNLETKYLRMIKPFVFWHLLVFQFPLSLSTPTPILSLPNILVFVLLECDMFSCCNSFRHAVCSTLPLFFGHPLSLSLAVNSSRTGCPFFVFHSSQV